MMVFRIVPTNAPAIPRSPWRDHAVVVIPKPMAMEMVFPTVWTSVPQTRPSQSRGNVAAGSRISIATVMVFRIVSMGARTILIQPMRRTVVQSLAA